MTMYKLLLLVTCIFLQIYYGSSAAISDENNSQLSDLSQKLLSVIKEESENLVKGKETLKSIVNTAKESLHFEFEQLRQYIRETNFEAIEENKDISSCLGEDSLDTINISKIVRCDQRSTVEYIQGILDNLTNRHVSFFSEISLCNEEVNKEETVDNCVKNKMNELEAAIREVQILANSILKNGYEFCLRCTKIYLNKIDKEIIFLGRKFMSCVDEIMEYD